MVYYAQDAPKAEHTAYIITNKILGKWQVGLGIATFAAAAAAGQGRKVIGTRGPVVR